MTFSEEQILILSQWEENFRTAIKAQWARNPGRTALKTIWEIFTKATGDSRRFNDNCSHCILSLLHDCGEKYYKDVEEMAIKEKNGWKVETNVEIEGDEVVAKRVSIKTEKRRKTKK